MMFIVNRILIDSRWKELVIGLIDGILVILVIGGGVFHWFPWEPRYVVMVIAVFLLSYFMAYGIRLVENKITTDKINQIIKEKRK